MTSSARLLYESLGVSDVDTAMKDSLYGFTGIYQHLTKTKQYLSHPDNYRWSRWQLCEDDADLPKELQSNEKAAWIEILEPTDDASSTRHLEVFFDDHTEYLEEADSPRASRGQQSNGDQLQIVERRPNENRLLVTRTPSMGLVGVRPNTYIVDMQTTALRQLQNTAQRAHAPLHRLVQSARTAIWPALPDDAPVEQWYVLTDDSKHGTEQQRRFVEKALKTPDFAILEGPPGSGKTTAICELIDQYVARGARVLVCASTHVAVDNVLERLDSQTNPLREQIVALRIGRTSRVSGHLEHLTLQHRVETERKRILQHLNSLEQPTLAQERLHQLLGASGQGVERLVLDAANVVCGTTIGILQHPDIRARQHRAHQLFDVLILDEASKTTLPEFLVPAVHARRWILSGDVRQLSPFQDQGEIAAHLKHLIRGQEPLAIAGLDFHELQQSNELKRILLEDSDPKWSEVYIDKATELGIPTETDWEGRSPIDEKKGLVLCPDLRRIPKAALTASGTRARRPQIVEEDVTRWSDELAWRLGTRFDLRFTEELGRPIQRAIDRLMPPIITYRRSSDSGPGTKVHEAIEQLERIALPSTLESLQQGFGAPSRRHAPTALSAGMPPGALSQRHELLAYQHRMHPRISHFPRDHFYNGQALKDSPSVQSERNWGYRGYSDRVVWAHVNNRGRSESTGNANASEAAWIAQELRTLHRWNETTPSSTDWTVAVICFYRDQERELRKHLRTLSGQPRSFRQFELVGRGGSILIDLCTVDGIQGQEADIVFLSLAANRTTWFTRSMNRVNVALTRARYQLVIVGDHHAISRTGPPSPLKLLANSLSPIITWKPDGD